MNDAKSLAEKLLKKRGTNQGHFFIDRSLIQQFIQDTIEIINPHCYTKEFDSTEDLTLKIQRGELQLYEILKFTMSHHEATGLAESFFNELGSISDLLDLDAQAIFNGDPAARSVGEVIFSYPGYFSIAVHRMAHFLYQKQTPLLPRMFSEYAHQLTGIDIHPGAQIGKHFYIDHGTGIVIGETTQIGEYVKIYQGVTLGALSVEKSGANKKRHPTIEDRSIIYSNATILGGETVIGHNSIIGGNVWLTKSVPPNSVVYHKSDIKFASQQDE